MRDIKIGVFAYNFPHKKTQDMLFRLHCEGMNIVHVLAADPVKLNIPPSSIRSKVRHCALLHPNEIANSLNLPYSVVAHNGDAAQELVKTNEIDLGIVAGARILKGPVIDAFNLGVINFHPGLIPEARGLDAMLWSIHHDIPLGVTAHLIDERVDAGQILLRQEIEIHSDDTIFDLSERLYEVQLEMISPSVAAAISGEGSMLEPGTKLQTKMPADQEQLVLKKMPEYVTRFANV